MTDLQIRYPGQQDILPYTTTVTVTTADNINALRESILNMQTVLGLNVNIGLFTPDPTTATVADRLIRIERGIAEGNMVFKEINVSDALQVRLDRSNRPFVNIGLGTDMSIAPVVIKGPLTILSPMLADPRTLIQTPVTIDVTSFNPEMSTNSLIKGKANTLQPLLRIHDTGSDGYGTAGNPVPSDVYAVHIIGNLKIEGILEAEFSIDHSKLRGTETTPTDSTRGTVKHVSQGNWHSHRKGRYDDLKKAWVVDDSISTADYGVLNHSDLQGWGTLPTHDNSFTPLPGVAYHVSGGDTHSHANGDGAQIDHNNLKNINPNFSNHVQGGNTHIHDPSVSDGGQISHTFLSDVDTFGVNALHVTGGDSHNHGLDQDGNPIGNGAQLDHNHLLNIDPNNSNHVQGGNAHTHNPESGDGAQISHTFLSDKGLLTHDEIDAKIATFKSTNTGNASFISTSFDEIQITHGMGTDQFNVFWSINGINYAPPSSAADVGVIYVANKDSSTFKLKRIGGSIPGPAVKAQMTTNLTPANKNIQWIARNPGAAGNTISIEYESEAANDPILSGNQIYVEATSIPPTFVVHFDSSNKPTASQVRAAVLQNPVAATYLTADIVSVGDGYIDGYAATNLSGGLDNSGFQQLSIDWTTVAKI
jgi:hypothetical protein